MVRDPRALSFCRGRAHPVQALPVWWNSFTKSHLHSRRMHLNDTVARRKRVLFLTGLPTGQIRLRACRCGRVCGPGGPGLSRRSGVLPRGSRSRATACGASACLPGRRSRPETRHHPERHGPSDRCPPAGDAGDPDLWLSATRSAAGSLRASSPSRECHRLHPHRSTEPGQFPLSRKGHGGHQNDHRTPRIGQATRAA